MNLAASKKVIEEFMDLFMGVLSVAGGPVAMGITGMNLLVSSGKIVRNYDTYKKAIEVILYNRSFIERTPRLSTARCSQSLPSANWRRR